jgi:hypothetical protein
MEGAKACDRATNAEFTLITKLK